MYTTFEENQVTAAHNTFAVMVTKVTVKIMGWPGSKSAHYLVTSSLEQFRVEDMYFSHEAGPYENIAKVVLLTKTKDQMQFCPNY